MYFGYICELQRVLYSGRKLTLTLVSFQSPGEWLGRKSENCAKSCNHMIGQVLKGGQRKGGHLHLVASALYLCTARPAIMLSHKCDIPLLPTARPHRVQQSLSSTLSACGVSASSYCHPSRHANVVKPCLPTPCLNLPNILYYVKMSSHYFEEVCHYFGKFNRHLFLRN